MEKGVNYSEISRNIRKHNYKILYGERLIKPDIKDCNLFDKIVGTTIWLGYVPVHMVRTIAESCPNYESGWLGDWPPRPVQQFIKKTREIRKLELSDLLPQKEELN